jgi:hypothetical protein
VDRAPVDGGDDQTPVRQPASVVAGPTYAVAGWVFCRLLGIVYFLAFWSLARQVVGLIGHDGILPAHNYMDNVRAWAGAEQIGIDR